MWLATNNTPKFAAVDFVWGAKVQVALRPLALYGANGLVATCGVAFFHMAGGAEGGSFRARK